MMEDRVIEFKKPLKVLIVEDTNVDRRMLEAMLSEESNATSLLKSSTSLAEALSILEQHEFDVVVLDLNLPDSLGENSLKELRERYPKVAIVVNTGAYEDDLGLKTLGWGSQDFLVKGKYNAYVLNKVLHYAVERKRLEDELRNAYKQIKETQAQLIQSEKLKVVGGLASGVAHEVKNPLATILYGITFLDEQLQEKGEKVDCVLKNIKEGVHRANTIITDLLDFSSLTKLKMNLENINQIVEKALSLTGYQLHKDYVKVMKEFDENIPQINVDRNKIEQVFVNLILNAIHAMPRGGTLTVRTRSMTLSEDFKELPWLGGRGGIYAGQQIEVIEVEDTGVGIPEESLDKIFDPFFTSRRTKGGVGLGLSVIRNIMEIHKGYVWVENKAEGKGARAYVVFPVELKMSKEKESE